jgi:hypothetical protein
MGQIPLKLVLWSVGLVLLALVATVVYWNCSSGLWRSIYTGRDHRLVGTWTGDLKPRYRVELFRIDGIPYDSMTFELREDGSMKVLDGEWRGANFRWGTEGDRLQFKYPATDYWATPEFTFSVGPDGKTVRLDPPTTSYQISGTWKRAKP